MISELTAFYFFSVIIAKSEICNCSPHSFVMTSRAAYAGGRGMKI